MKEIASPMLEDFYLKPCWLYFLCCLLGALVVRLFITGLTALAFSVDPKEFAKTRPGYTIRSTQTPKAPDTTSNAEATRKKPTLVEACKAVFETWKAVFSGKDPRFYDLWITFLIGLFELGIYPVLIRSNQVAIIGGWLALKTASAVSWKD